MPTAFPSAADVFTTIPSGTQLVDEVGARTHRAFHNDLGDAVEAVQEKLGVGATNASASAATSDDLLYISGGQSRWGKPALAPVLNADSYVATLRNNHANSKTLTLLTPSGGTFLKAGRNGSNDGMTIGDEASLPSASRLLVANQASTGSYVVSDTSLIATAAQDSGAFRGVATANGTGAIAVRAVEAQVKRMAGTATENTWGVEVGVHSEVLGNTENQNVGIRILSSHAGWTPTGVKNDAGVHVGGGDGWNYGFFYAGTAGALLASIDETGQFKGGNVVPRAGSTYLCGTGALPWLVVTANVINVTATGTPSAPNFAKYGIGTAGPYVGAGSSTGLTVGAADYVELTTSGLALEKSLMAKKGASVSTPASGYSAIGVKTDELWYRKTSAAAEYFFLDSGSTIARSQLGAVSKVKARHNANQSLTNATSTILALNTEIWDDGGFHDNVTNNSRFTVPSGLAGKYVVIGAAAFASNAIGLRLLTIRVNGTIMALNLANAVNGDDTYMDCSAELDLAVGDYVELYGYQTSGGALDVNAYNPYSPSLSMHLLN